MANFDVITHPKNTKPKRSWLWPLLIVGGLFLACVGSFFVLVVFYVIVAAPDSNGSPELAAQWRDEMKTWDSPDDATNESTVSVHHFPNGEWVIVKAKNCHAGLWSGGGTVVVKDSDGSLNIFHEGHVCGDGNLLIDVQQRDLESFYNVLVQSGFREFEIE